jgi:hypothetical protein
MKKIIQLIVFFLFVIPSFSQEFVAVVNKNYSSESINSELLKKLYLGKSVTFSNGIVKLAVYDKEADKSYYFLFKRTKKALTKFWTKKVLRGDSGSPPEYFDSTEALIKYISENSTGICIAPKNLITSDEVKIISIDQ